MRVAPKRIKTASFVFALLAGGVGLAASSLVANGQSTNGLTPSPAGAEVYFNDLKDGAKVPEKLR
ncbi:MAG: hypothetical protein ACRD5Z_14605, partial [Bryobacteraceae bacterium]